MHATVPNAPVIVHGPLTFDLSCLRHDLSCDRDSTTLNRYVRLSETGRVSASCRRSGRTHDELLGVASSWPVAINADAIKLRELLLGPARDLLEIIHTGRILSWDGPTRRGELDEIADAAAEMLTGLLVAEFGLPPP